MQAQSDAQRGAIPRAPAAAQPRQRAEHQTTGDSRNRTAPIRVHPVTQHAELHDREQAADQRPARRGPRAQHPISQRAQRRYREQNARPRIPEQKPARCHRQALPEREDRAVRGVLQHEYGFEELAHRVRGVRQSEMPQRIGEQPVTEIVRPAGRGRRSVRQQRQPQQHRQRRQRQHTPGRALRQPRANGWASARTSVSNTNNAASASSMKSLAPNPMGLCRGKNERKKSNRNMRLLQRAVRRIVFTIFQLSRKARRAMRIARPCCPTGAPFSERSLAPRDDSIVGQVGNLRPIGNRPPLPPENLPAPMIVVCGLPLCGAGKRACSRLSGGCR